MRTPKEFFGLAAAFLAILVFSFRATASDLVVSPTRMVLDGKNPSAVMTLRNAGQEARVIQAELLRWTQEGAKDVYTPTRDLLVNPPVFTLPAGRSQLIRVGLNRSPDVDQELAYRLYIQEVPPPRKPGFTGLQMALRIGVPVFVSPKAPLYPRIRWQATRTPTGMIKLTVTNEGNFHILLTDIRLMEPSNHRQIIGWYRVHTYMLPGQTHELALTPEFDWKGDRFNLSTRTDKGVVDTELALEKEKQ